jgi:type II secretory pathway component GspD/PulD (secretin)
MIEAMIVDVTLNDEMHYGWDWTVSKTVGDAMTWGQRLTVGAGVNAAAAPGDQITFTLTRGFWTMSGIWDFIETHDNTKVLANPKILAINNRQATIEIIDEIPYQVLTQTSQGGQIGTTSFKEVGIKLTVTPRIAADGRVHLAMAAEQSSPTGAAVNQIPVIQTRRANNVMVVDDGRTIVIGGLRRRRTVTNEDKTPVMGNLPLIGGLFRRSESVEVETELVIFITPHIVAPDQSLTGREHTLAEAIDHPDTRSLLERSDPLRNPFGNEAERARHIP